ncbi:BTAD domain-containing putative transcriptional regulator [Clostridiaceae bacterium 35-E11]
MDVVRVKLFGTPVVLKNQETIVFPLKKAEALFYYLLVNGQASRDTLVNLLWGEIGEKTAKKNLRNAMYKIRKMLDMDIIISPKKSIVMLNPDIQIDTDLNTFLKDEEQGVHHYTGEFLKGFHVKDAHSFEEWMMQYREQYKDLYIHRLYEKIDKALKTKKYKNVQDYGKLIIAEDPFDERAYRVLMQVYAEEGAFNKSIDLYNKLSEILEQELGIAPDAETKGLLNEILESRTAKETDRRKNKQDFFYGRRRELQVFNDIYKDFIKNQDVKSLMIVGEAGIGKTKLKDKFLHNIDEKEITLLHANCYQAEEEYLLKPWNDIFAKLSDILVEEKIEIPLLWKNIITHLFPIFAVENNNIVSINPVEKIDSLKYQAAEETIIGLFNKVCEKRKIILVFEDLQWMDHRSLSLLSSILLHQENKDRMMIGTCRSGYGEKIDTFMTSMVKYNKLEKIIIPRFTLEEVEDFVEKALPNYQWTMHLKQQIYEETAGNTFFLVELLNNMKEKGNMTDMSPKMQDIIKSRFIDISDEGKKLLNIASMFFDKVPLEMLKTLRQKEALEMMDALEELERKGILNETGSGEDISFVFTHQKLREFVYLQQSNTRRKILHNKIGTIFEQSLYNDKRDRFLYPKLIYHFTNGGNELMALKYRMKNLDVYLNFTHELFPILSDGNIEGEHYSYLDQEEVIRQLEEMEKLLEGQMDRKQDEKELMHLRIRFLHMKGRYFIREGEYEKGIAFIENMIEEALRIEDPDYALKGYRQMIYYGIQTHNIPFMQEYLEHGLKLAKACGYQKETGIFLRLEGLHKIMMGEFKEAEEILKQSIAIFQVVNQYEDKYTLNLAASYNYIGEIRRYNMKFASALAYYDRAMQLCKEKKVLRGLTIFNTNAGQAALDMGDHHRAKTYLKTAIDLYNQVNTLWGRSTAEGYMALLHIKDGEYKEALDCLLRAQEYAEKLKSPYELGLLYRVKAEIKGNMRHNQSLEKIFSKYLPLDLGEYCDRGIALLKEVHESYEIEILKVLKKSGERFYE